MKRRILTISLVVAALVLLVSIGFAGWVISSSHTDTKVGDFQAYAVNNNGTLTVEICNADGTTTGSPNSRIVYGKPSSTNQTTIEGKSGFNKWLDFTEMNEEVLVVYIKLTLTNATEAQTFTLTNEFKKSGSTQPVYNLIADPSYAKVYGDSAIANTNEVTLTDGQSIVISVTYNWGSEFDGKNPYEYFNLQSKSTSTSGSINGQAYTTYETKANVALSQLNTLVSGLSYNVTVADK